MELDQDVWKGIDVPVKNPRARIVSPETDRDKIASSISDIDRVPDHRILVVVGVSVSTPDYPELVLDRTY